MRNLTSRTNMIGLSLTLFAILIIVQMVRIQTSTGGQALKDWSNRTYVNRKVTIDPPRGIIYDRWGHQMAGNKEVYEVGVDLATVRTPAYIAKEVNSVLGTDYAKVLGLASTTYVQQKMEYVPLARGVSPENIEKFRLLIKQYREQALKLNLRKGEKAPSLSGLVWTPYLQRTYPEKSVAGNILGFTTFLYRETTKPFYGVEEHYDRVLAGSPLEVELPIDPNMVQPVPYVPPGVSLVLTIDREIQSVIENILDNAVKNSNSESGTIIVEDPKTGEILAMATTPRMDPNKYWEVNKEFDSGKIPYNRAIGGFYEPGSVFKVLTMASALDAGAVKPETTFLDTGTFNAGGYAIHNWDYGAWGEQTMTGCMQHSLNVCLSWVATQLGAAKFYAYLKEFGIGQTTGIDMAGEVNFPLAIPGDNRWAEVNLATNSFGQGVATTPIQMIAAIAAVANDGKLMVPHVVKAYMENGTLREVPPKLFGQPIKSQTAHTLTAMLATSLEEEASSALVPGYKVAGKTGTGSIPTESGYTLDLTNASFVGWGPVDNPQFIVYVWLEKPKTSPWGSIVASPVFSDVVKQLVVLMKIPPDETRQALYKK